MGIHGVSSYQIRKSFVRRVVNSVHIIEGIDDVRLRARRDKNPKVGRKV
jgi:hypothetical protein